MSWKSAEFHVGSKLNREEIEKVFAKQFIPLAEGTRWFLVDFVHFQYGQLNPNNPAHKGAIEELQRYSLLASDYSILLPTNSLDAPSKDLQSSFEGTMVMVKDKVKVKDKDKDEAKVKFGQFVMLTPKQHASLKAKLGESRAAKAIEILDAAIGSKGYKYVSHYHTMFSWVIRELEDQERVARKNGGASRDPNIRVCIDCKTSWDVRNRSDCPRCNPRDIGVPMPPEVKKVFEEFANNTRIPTPNAAFRCTKCGTVHSKGFICSPTDSAGATMH